MKVFFQRLWQEPVLVGAVAVALLNAALFLPDWKAAAGSLSASLAVGVGVRSRVTAK